MNLTTKVNRKIGPGIHNVSSVVQQTAHGSQQTAETAGELAGVARDLQSTVGRFRL